MIREQPDRSFIGLSLGLTAFYWGFQRFSISFYLFFFSPLREQVFWSSRPFTQFHSIVE